MSKASELDIFNKLYSDYKDRFIRFAYTYIRDATMAEDIVVDSLIKYWEYRDNLEEDTNVPAYVLTIVKYKCLNYLQHEQLCRDVAQDMQSHAQWKLSTRIATLEACEPYELFTAEAQEIVNRTLKKLPERTREIFVMSRMKNMSHREIAAELDMTTKGVEFHITKALKELRISLKDYLPVFFYFFLH